jgi:mRNA degradation ribonuclease J1/J2
MEQQHRLIKIFRTLHRAQLKNYADANGGAVPPMSAEEIELLNNFKTLSSRVNRSAASLPRRAEALAAASRLQHTIAPADEVQLSEDEESRIMAVIERQREQIDALARAVDEKRSKRAAARKAREPDAFAHLHGRPTSALPSASTVSRAPASSLFALPSLRRRA